MLNKDCECPIAKMAISPNVINVLDQPVWMADQHLCKLTDEELDYCISAETRKSGLKSLLAYKKYRKESRICREGDDV